MAYSSDGVTWIQAASSIFGIGEIRTDLDIYTMFIAWVSDKFVAIGKEYSSGEGAHYYLAHSTNGITWTRVTNSVFPYEGDQLDIKKIVWVGNGFVAFGGWGTDVFIFID
jgi:hypothetical protein